MLNRLVAFLSAAAMTCSFGLTGLEEVVLKTSANEIASTNSSTLTNASVEASNSVGSLVMNAMETEESDTDNAVSDIFGISEVIVENNSARVSYYAVDACTIVVGFYSDDGTELLASCQQMVSATSAENGNEEVSIPLPSDMPEYYLLKAYILGEFQLPLGSTYSTKLYTKNVSDIRNAKASDFEEEYVIQLDENKDTNFLVLSESTIQIPYDGKHNLLENYDEENGIYVFTNADENLTSLKKGDVAYYDYNEQEDMLVFTIGSISINGSTVTIQETEMELSDAFDLAKIEYKEYALPDFEEDTLLDSGLIFNGLVEDIDDFSEDNTTAAPKNLPGKISSPQTVLAKKEFNGSITPEAASYTLSGDFFPPSKDNSANSSESNSDSGSTSGSTNDSTSKSDDESIFSAKISGSLTLKVKIPINWKLYANWLDSYAEITVKPEISLDGKIGISGEINIPIPGLKINRNFLNLVSVNVGLSFQLKGEIDIQFNTSISMPFTLTIGNSDAELLSMGAPELKGNIEVAASVFMGFVAKAEGKVGDREAKAEVKVGAEASGTLFTFIEASTSNGLSSSLVPDETEMHLCQKCFDGEIKLKFSATVKYPDPKNKHVSVTKPFLEMSIHWKDFHFSYEHGGWGWEKCPFKAYRVLFNVSSMKKSRKNRLNLL